MNRKIICTLLISCVVLCAFMISGGTAAGFPMLTYDGNGQSLPKIIQPQAIVAGEPVKIYENVSIDHKYYTFLGWSTDPAATTPEYQPGDYYTKGVSATLYAIWKGTTDLGTISSTKTVHCDALPNNGTSWFSFTVNETGTYFIKTDLSNNSTSDGVYKEETMNYIPIFGQWGQEGITAELEAGVQYYLSIYSGTTEWNLTFSTPNGMLYYDGNGQSLPKIIQPQAIVAGEPVKIYENVSIDHKYYTFLGWSTDPAATTPEYQPGDYYTKGVSATLYAIWKGTTDLGTISSTKTVHCDALPNNGTSWFSFTVNETGTYFIKTDLSNNSTSDGVYKEETMNYNPIFGQWGKEGITAELEAGVQYYLSISSGNTEWNLTFNAPNEMQNDEKNNSIPNTDTAKISSFVSRCYNLILGRDADEGGLNNWVNQLESGSSNAATIISNFLGSQEFANSNKTKTETVDILYNTMLNRPADEAGKAHWTGILESAGDNSAVINGFCGSQEFLALCQDYGIEAGSVPTGSASTGTGLEGFVSRCYAEALGRGSDEGGLAYWCNILQNKEQTPQQVAAGFVFSDEMNAKEKIESNPDALLDSLYKLYLGRPADEGGKAYWKQRITEGLSLEDLNAGFAYSNEFSGIVASYGL